MSVRAAFAPGCSICGASFSPTRPEITLFRSAGSVVEQSSREIWQAVCYCIKTAVASAGVAVIDCRDRLRCHLLAGGDWR
jgi:ribulose kinase